MKQEFNEYFLINFYCKNESSLLIMFKLIISIFHNLTLYYLLSTILFRNLNKIDLFEGGFNNQGYIYNNRDLTDQGSIKLTVK